MILAKIGRPKSENPKSNRFSIRLDDETQSKLDDYCDKHSISKGEAIRQGLQLLFKKKK